MCLSKASVSIDFDSVIRTTNGSVAGIKFLVNESPDIYSSLSYPFYGKRVKIKEFHKMLGHCGSDRLEKTTKIHDVKLKGEFKIFEQSDIAKARQKNAIKDWEGKSQVPEERSHLDISFIKDLSYGGSNFWALIMTTIRIIVGVCS
jgi:hypothetical protein